MEKKTDTEILLEYMPAFTVWQKLTTLYLIQLVIFVLIMIFYWQISILFFLGAIIGQLIVSVLLVFHFIFIANRSEKIRDKYRRKYGNLAGQHFWYNYLSYVNPIVSAAFYFPLLLINYNTPSFHLIQMPDHFITNSLFPIFIALPLGIFVISIGLLIRRTSGSYGTDVDSYLYMIFPEKGRLITDGLFKYIRNPQYLCRGIISIGFGVIANNIGAIIVGFIHFLSYCAIIPAEDRELIRRFGNEFQRYQKNVPMLFPKCRNWKKLLK